jgi:hypothetical protein
MLRMTASVVAVAALALLPGCKKGGDAKGKGLIKVPYAELTKDDVMVAIKGLGWTATGEGDRTNVGGSTDFGVYGTKSGSATKLRVGVWQMSTTMKTADELAMWTKENPASAYDVQATHMLTVKLIPDDAAEAKAILSRLTGK